MRTSSRTHRAEKRIEPQHANHDPRANGLGACDRAAGRGETAHLALNSSTSPASIQRVTRTGHQQERDSEMGPNLNH